MSKNNQYKDFDQFFQETEKKGIPFKLFGKDEELAPSLPAMILVKLARMQKQHGDFGDLPEAEQFELAFSIFGNDRVEEWASKGLTVDQLTVMIEWAMEQYTGKKTGKTKRA